MTSESESLRGKHVVITGGSRGIGLAMALACRSQGAAVTVLARSEHDLTDAREQLAAIASPADILALRADVSSATQLGDALAKAAGISGPIYGLVCAGGIYGAIAPFAEADFADWERTITVNLVGTARTIHLALPHMPATGGRIVLLAGGGQGSMPNFSDYVTSKGAIWRLTETLGEELAAKKIFVNAIAPGAVNTRLLDELLEAGQERVGEEIYQKSLAQQASGGQSPDAAAGLCLYLLSDDSTGLYGKTISAVWDPFSEFEDLPGMSQSDLFTFRRVVTAAGGTRP